MRLRKLSRNANRCGYLRLKNENFGAYANSTFFFFLMEFCFFLLFILLEKMICRKLQ